MHSAVPDPKARLTADDAGPAQPTSETTGDAHDVEEESEDDEHAADDGDEGDEGDAARDSIGIPISNEAKLQHGARPVSALALDPAAARLVTGMMPMCHHIVLTVFRWIRLTDQVLGFRRHEQVAAVVSRH